MTNRRRPSQNVAAIGIMRPSYDHLPPLIRRMAEEAWTRKIGSKIEAEKSAQHQAQQGVKADSGDICAVAAQHPAPIIPSAPHSTPTKAKPKPYRTKTLQAAVNRLGDLSKPWRDLWKHEQLARAFEAAGQSGGLVFTLDLSPDRERFLLQRADPADDLRRYLARELRKTFGRAIPYAFIFEVSPKGRLHVHGVVLPPSKSDADRALLREALARAGGRINGKGAARQVDLDDVTDGFGWAAYCQKAFDTACEFLGTHKITFISTDLTRIAKG